MLEFYWNSPGNTKRDKTIAKNTFQVFYFFVLESVSRACSVVKFMIDIASSKAIPNSFDRLKPFSLVDLKSWFQCKLFDE